MRYLCPLYDKNEVLHTGSVVIAATTLIYRDNEVRHQILGVQIRLISHSQAERRMCFVSDKPDGRVAKASLWIQGIIRSVGLEPTKEAIRSVFSATDQDASSEYEAYPHMDTRSFSHEKHPEIFALSILVGGGGDPGKHEVIGILLRRAVGTLASQSRCKPRNGFSMKPDDVFQRVGRFNFRGRLNDFGGLLRFHNDHHERPGVLINMKQWHEEAEVIEII